MIANRSELFLDIAQELLKKGRRVRFRATGHSMQPTIRDGETIVVEPAEPGQLETGDIVLYRAARGVTAHRLTSREGARFVMRGDALRAPDEPVEAAAILGRVATAERPGESVGSTNRRGTIVQRVKAVAGQFKELAEPTKRLWQTVAAIALTLAMAGGASGQSIGTPQNLGTTSKNAAGTSLALTTINSSVASGNTIILTLSYLGASQTISVADNATGGSNTYVADKCVTLSTTLTTCIYHSSATHALATGGTITVTLTTAVRAVMAATMVTGLLSSSSPTDKTAANSGTGTTFTSNATATTSQPTEIMIGALGINSNSTITRGETQVTGGTAQAEIASQTSLALVAEYSTLSAIGTPSATGSTSASHSWTAVAVTYKATPGTASRLVFTTTPSATGTGGTVLAQQPVVTAEDAGGNTVTSYATGITLAINTGTGTLTCTTNPVTPSSGVATFAGCKLDKATTYTLKATSGTITNSTTNPTVTISVGAATQIAFTTQPGGGTAGTAWSTQPAVTLEDAGGNAVTGTAQNVTLAIQNNAGPGGVLSGTLTVAVNTGTGVATFSGLSINKSGTGYTLTATGSTIDTTAGTVVSGAFNITAGAATQLVFTTQPGGGQVGQGAWISINQPVVAIEDAFGNTVTSLSSPVTLTPSSTSITCTNNPQTASSGVATFTGCQMPTAGTYTLTASITTPSSLSKVSSSFTIASATAVTVTSLKAFSSGSGNLVTMQTGREVANLGFNIYREQNGLRIKLNPSLLAGSALMGGAGTTFTAGHTRTWQDDLPGGASASVAYWVEEIDLHGARTWYGPVMPEGPSASVSSPRRAQPMSVSSAAVRAGAPTASPAVALAAIGRSSAVGISPAEAAQVEAAQVPASGNRAVPAQDPRMQFELAAGAAVRIGVAADGWYRITQAQLAAASLPAGVSPATLRLYVNGVEQPMAVETTADGRLAAIAFYGQAIDTIWSGTQAYWLVAGEPGGMRIATPQPRRAVHSSDPSSFPFGLQWKPRTLYIAALLNGDGNNFFGPALVSGEPLSQTINISNLNTTVAGTSPLQITLQGVIAGPHQVSVSLNGNPLGTMSFSDTASSTATFQTPNSYFTAGANTLGLTVTGGDTDVSVVDNVVLTYPHSYVADTNSLRFTANGGLPLSIRGFTDASVHVIDITNPSAPALVAFTFEAGTASFVAPSAGTRTLLAVGDSQVASPAGIAASQRSEWHEAQQGGDMVIVAHSSLLTAVAPLAALRQSQGHTVKVIDVQSLYDEFNYGVESPYAIRNFLASANSNWVTKPAFVLLAGNGTFDPRNYLQTAVPNLVPAKLVDTSLLETASDDWFADFGDTGIPQMAIGRIPADNPAEAANAVNRLIAYDQATGAGWKNRALFVAGVDENSGDNFESYTAAVEALAPPAVTVSRILAGSDANAHADLLAALTSGQGLVNYTGHGSNEIWADGLLNSTDALALTNGAMTPVVLSMTCLNGFFQDVYTDPLGKALLNSTGGGAVAVWASSGLTDPSPQSNIDQTMVEALYGRPGISVGEAARAAKAATTDMDVRRTWNLLGDPSLRLR